MIERELLISNQLGLHARAAAKLVSCATGFECRLMLVKDNREVNAKSIMGVMMLAATRGTRLTLSADGSDAELAAAAIEALVNDKFGEGQ